MRLILTAELEWLPTESFDGRGEGRVEIRIDQTLKEGPKDRELARALVQVLGMGLTEAMGELPQDWTAPPPVKPAPAGPLTEEVF